MVNNAFQSSSRIHNPGQKPLCSILCSSERSDLATEWAFIAGQNAAETFFSHFGRRVSSPAANCEDKERVLDQANASQIVIFPGHAGADNRHAELQLGSPRITVADANLAEAFLLKGARCVVGTLSLIPYNVANVFFDECLRLLTAGVPADYAFFFAHRKTVLFEELKISMSVAEATQTATLLIDEASRTYPQCDSFKEIVAGAGLELFQVKRLKELGFKQRQRASLGRIVVRNDLHVIDCAWVVIQALNRGIELTAPTDQACAQSGRILSFKAFIISILWWRRRESNRRGALERRIFLIRAMPERA